MGNSNPEISGTLVGFGINIGFSKASFTDEADFEIRGFTAASTGFCRLRAVARRREYLWNDILSKIKLFSLCLSESEKYL